MVRRPYKVAETMIKADLPDAWHLQADPLRLCARRGVVEAVTVTPARRYYASRQPAAVIPRDERRRSFPRMSQTLPRLPGRYRCKMMMNCAKSP